MAKGAGQDFLLYNGAVGAGTLVAGCTSSSVSIQNGMIDVTNKDSSGFREILDGKGIQSLSVSFSGLFNDSAIMETIEGYAQVKSLNTMHLRFPLLNSGNTTYKTIEASFYISNWNFDGDASSDLAFEMTLESSGTITYVAEAA